MKDTLHNTAALNFARPTTDTLLVRLSGSWTIEVKPPSLAELQRQVESTPTVGRIAIAFDTQSLTGWDSALLTFLTKLIAEAERRGIESSWGEPGIGVRISSWSSRRSARRRCPSSR